MAVHYGYNYKKDLVKRMRTQYSKELNAMANAQMLEAQLNDAQEMILKFFEDVKPEFNELEQASEGKVSFKTESSDFLAKMTIEEAYIQFTRRSHAIEIEIGIWNNADRFIESTVVAYVIPGEKRCRLKKVGKVHDGSNFDENAINSYIRMAFAHLLDLEHIQDPNYKG